MEWPSKKASKFAISLEYEKEVKKHKKVFQNLAIFEAFHLKYLGHFIKNKLRTSEECWAYLFANYSYKKSITSFIC